MPNPRAPGKLFPENSRGEDLADQTHPRVAVQRHPIGRHNPGRFVSAMLLREDSRKADLRGIGHAPDPEQAALFLLLVVVLEQRQRNRYVLLQLQDNIIRGRSSLVFRPTSCNDHRVRGKPKKAPRHKDQTDDLLSESFDDDRVERRQRFSSRNKNLQQNKTLRTALMRAEEQIDAGDIEKLPIGVVMQVFSLYSEVEHEGTTYLCVLRKTLAKVSKTQFVVGDLVRFRVAEDGAGTTGEGIGNLPQAVIEQILPRKTVLARADSFKAIDVHPIVANAQQMLIVASLHQPNVKWGLVDRMIVAAQSGGLKPIVCLNKIDLGDTQEADAVLRHYQSLNIQTLRTSITQTIGLEALRDILRDRTTVLAGHSGVGKSSLIRAIQPSLDLRIGEISRYTDKGRHTTTSARRYPLEMGGYVVDTPGVKVFGLWNVRRENLIDFFPDVAADTAPDWRRASYGRIVESAPND